MMKSRHVDVAVIGAGAAGIFAALYAARAGRSVILLEKNSRPGLKILISGGGRCNLTTTRTGADLEEQYGKRRGLWLRHALRSFPPQALCDLVQAAGVPLREEDLEKIFPVSGKAMDVLVALLRLLDEAGVAVLKDAAVTDLVTWKGGLVVVTADGETHADRVVLSCGGLSYPRTGSTGDGYGFCQRLGHSLVPPVPALAPLEVTAPWVRELAGLTIRDLSLTLLDAEGGVLLRRCRPVLFTHKGLSGPGAMDLAGAVEEQAGGCRLQMDFAPEFQPHELEQVLLAAAKEQGRRLVLNCLPRSIPERIRKMLTEQAGAIGGIAELPRERRRRLVHLLKQTEVKVERSLGFKHAEVTRGGIPLSEVDARSMQSKIVPDLYLCGEILDVDGPIGGFNFQAAFATGRLAGIAAGSPAHPAGG